MEDLEDVWSGSDEKWDVVYFHQAHGNHPDCKDPASAVGTSREGSHKRGEIAISSSFAGTFVQRCSEGGQGHQVAWGCSAPAPVVYVVCRALLWILSRASHGRLSLGPPLPLFFPRMGRNGAGGFFTSLSLNEACEPLWGLECLFAE